MTDEQLREFFDLQRRLIELLEELVKNCRPREPKKPRVTDEELKKEVIDTLEGLTLQLTQTAIAQALGVTPAAVSYYINGKQIPSPLVVKKIRRLAKCYPPED